MKLLFLWPVLSLLLGVLLTILWFKIKTAGFQRLAKEIVEKAEQEAEKKKIAFELHLKEKESKHQKELEKEEELQQKRTSKEEERLKAREQHLDNRLSFLEQKLTLLAKKEELLARAETNLLEKERTLKETEQKISGLSQEEAKRYLLDRLDAELAKEKAEKIEKVAREIEEESEKRAHKLVVGAIQRLALPTVSEVTITTVHLPNEEMKGRIIGREGRNIKTLEQATGVNFLFDDTPGAIIISTFDPMRKMVAKLALAELVSDGRVHPTRILEVVAKAKENLQKEILRQGQEAAFECKIGGLHPHLLAILGQLSLCNSYGQNVLKHSIEVSFLMGMIAQELGLDAALARRIGLLHDIGKALSHEIEGSHTLSGHELLLKYGESPAVANGVGCHHGEMLPSTLEGALCSPADAISAGRPGARGEAIERYFKRIKDLENIAKTFKGVERAYALQAGKEIEVLITPDLFDDASMVNLARDIAKKISITHSQKEKIKITLIRESRTVVYT